MAYTEKDYQNDLQRQEDFLEHINKTFDLDYSKPKEFDYIFKGKEPIDYYKEQRDLKIVESGKRHVIKVNGIDGYKNSYSKVSVITINNIIKEKVKAFAFFDNEYIPEHFPKDKEYIKYLLYINGKEYNIVPINSNKNGLKIIKFYEGVNNDYTTYINEEVTDFYMNIVIETPNKYETPYISNINFLIDNEEDERKVIV